MKDSVGEPDSVRLVTVRVLGQSVLKRVAFFCTALVGKRTSVSRASLLIAFLAALAFTPGTVEAFSFNQTHSLWQEPAHIQSAGPVYVGPIVPGFGTTGYFSDPVESGTFPSYQALCAFHAAVYGYTASSDFFCVYEAKLNSTSFGTPCFGTPCSPGVGTTNIYSGNVKLYPSSSIQTTSYAALTSQLDSAWTAWWADPSQPVPANPNACSSSEPFTGLFPPRGFFPANSQSADRCNIYRNSAPPTPPAATAAISASPSSIIAGSNSSISWSSTNATSCTGTNFSTGGATSGTASVSPGSTTTYSVQCTGPGGTSPVQQATVSVTPVLTASCSVNPGTIIVGQSATWTVTRSGGNGIYTQSWSGTDSISGSGTSISPTYGTPGTKTASVTVSSGGQSVSVNCGGQLYVRPAQPINLGRSCNAAGTQVTLSWAPGAGGASGYFVRMDPGTPDWPSAFITDYHTPTSITYAITPNQQYSWWVHSYTGPASWAAERTSDQTNSSFTCPGQSNVTAGPVTDRAVTVGVSNTYQSIVANTANNPTGGPFNVTFFFDNDQNNANGNLGTRAFLSGDPGGFPPNYSEPNAQVAFTYPSAGTFYYRACADLNASLAGGVINESIESDNCSNWATVTVKPLPPVGISHACSANGTSVTISWSAPAGGADNYYVRNQDSVTLAIAGNDGYVSRSITYTITPGRIYDWWVHSNVGAADYNPNRYSDASGLRYSCSPAPAADLTSSTGGPVAATAGQATTLTGTTQNNGNAVAAAGFDDLFIIYQADQTTWVTSVFAAPSGSIAGSASAGRSVSYTAPTTPGTYYYRLCADWNAEVSESNEENNCSGFQQLTVTAPAAPDLTTGLVTPTTAVAGQSTQFFATATNNGNAGTGGAFPILFQVQGGGLTQSGNVSPLAAGGSIQGFVYLTFPTPGTYQVRACANQTTAWATVVAESDTANNCGEYRTITVTAPVTPPITASCTLSPSSVTTSQNATWTVTRSGGNGTFTQSWTGTDGLSGTGTSVTRSYTTTGTKTASVTITSGGATETPTCPPLTVGAAPAADLLITEGSITPTTVTVNQSTLFRATARNQGNAGTGGAFPILFQVQGGGLTQSGNVSPLAAGASADGIVYLTFDTPGTYQLRACANRNSSWNPVVSESNPDNNCSTYVSVTVSTPPITASCTLSPTSVTTSQNATWTVTRSGGNGTFTQSWSGTDGLSGTGTSVTRSYTTTGTKTASVTVTSGGVTANPTCPPLTVGAAPAADLTAGLVTPTTAVAGQSTQFFATATNNGNAGTGGAFPILFQVQGGGLTQSGNVSPLAAGDSIQGFVYLTFPTAGTYQLRACANQTTTWNAVVAEPNTTNNCGEYRTITVNPAPAADLRAFGTVTPYTAVSGTPVELLMFVYNSGNGASTPFPVLFQIQSPATNIESSYVAAIAGGMPTAMSPAVVNHTFSSTGTYQVRACANQNAAGTFISPESNYGNNCSEWSPVTVSAPAAADLTTGLALPTTAVSGTPTTFRATVTNTGTVATTGSFPVLFQIENGATSQSANIGPLAPYSGSAQAFANLSFPTPGTYQVRACANRNSAWNPVVSESDPNNNCSAYRSVTVTTPPPSGILSCNVSPTNPAPNTSVTYTVTPSGGATGPYIWNDTQGGSYGSGATATRLIPDGNSYVMVVSGENVVTQPVSCPVVSGSCSTPSATITATPARVVEGATTTISWTASGVNTGCTVTGPGFNQAITSNACTIPNGSTTTTITTQSVYRISCDSASAESQVIVNVVPRFSDF